jgi:hypothetical protein
MATDPEAQTQLARLLRDESLASASPFQLHAAIDTGFDLLVRGIVAEASASDDVIDQESALSFVRLRLETLGKVLTEPEASRLFEAVRAKIEAW